MSLLEVIKKDILSKNAFVDYLKEINERELALAHFSIGMYIRNKYLWGKDDNINELSCIYGASTPDEISGKILREVYADLHNASHSSNPKR